MMGVEPVETPAFQGGGFDRLDQRSHQNNLSYFVDRRQIYIQNEIKNNTFELDYTKWQKNLFDGMSVEELSKKAAE